MIRGARIAGVLAVAVLAACSSGDGAEKAGPGSSSPTSRRSTTTSTTAAADDDLRLDQIQVIGTHNSFHVAADPAERKLLAAIDPVQASQREYSHRPLPEQLDTEKIRQLELDVFVDTKGGRYADPAFRRRAGLGPYDEPAMKEPGIKVLHEQDIDYHSVCVTLRACLTDVKTWSDAHPGHVPVAIDIQFKDGPLIFNVGDQAPTEGWTAVQMDALDAEILAVFGRDRIITPDDVRGDRPTLADAVKAKAWPTLGESRGKVLFLMINPEPYRSTYLQGHDGLRGRVLFTNAPPGQADAAYVGIDNPVKLGKRIRGLVAQGYLVRTRADQPGVEAKAGDTDRLEAALASGAQWVSTDYPGPDGAEAQYGTDYVAELPGFLAARCNPVTAPAGCVDARVEPDVG